VNFLEIGLEAVALVLGTLAAILTVPVLGLLAVVFGAVGFGMLLNRKSDS